MSRVLVGAGGRVGEEVQVEQGPSGPAQFWRGQGRYLVGEVLDSWVETAPWWQPDPGGGPAPQGWPLWVDDGSSPLSGSGVPLQPGTRPWYRQWRVLGPAVLVVLLVSGWSSEEPAARR